MILLVMGLGIGIMFGFLLGRHFELKHTVNMLDELIKKTENKLSELSQKG